MAILWLLLIFIEGSLSQETVANATCDEQMTFCTCPNLTEARVCRFELTIKQILTFTRYQTDAPPGSRGKVYFINETGQLQPVNPPRPTPTISCNEVKCSEANTVNGRTFRSFYAINGRIPGPTLIVHENQTVIADIDNLLSGEAISIHWHGMHQRNTPWMDGLGFISQCPISPGSSFRYIFRAFPPGTFWYHSHSGAQRTDGMYGGLIVLEGSNTTQEDIGIEFEDLPEKHTVTFLDWQREESLDLFAKVHSKIRYFPTDGPVDVVPTNENMFYNPTQAADGSRIGVIKYWSGLINGRGRHSSVPLNRSILTIFEVDEGNSYRFRLIGAQSVYAYNFSIDAHKLIVIATDGYFIKPVETDFVIVHTGERYDVVVTANQRNQTEQSDFWIRAHTLEVEKLEQPFPLIPNEALAILHYKSNQSDPPTPLQYHEIEPRLKDCSDSVPCTAVNCPFQSFAPHYNISCVNVHELELLYPTPDFELPSLEPDVEFIFNFAFENNERTSTINGRNFIFPSAALQTQTHELDTDRERIECNYNDTCENGCHCLHIHDIPYKKTIRIVISSVGFNGSMSRRRFSHPVHLHGHSFHVVSTGYGTYNNTTGSILSSSNDLDCSSGSNTSFCIRPQWRNESELNFTIDENTVRKDTVIVPAGGYVVMQFLSDNPGFWFLHCHIEPHQLEGMALVINEAQAQQNPPPGGMRSCGNFTWSVEAFNQKIKFDPDEKHSEGFAVWKISAIAAGGFLAVVIAVVATSVLVIRYRKRHRGSYETVR